MVGLGEIRFQVDGFLELANRLVDLAFPNEGDAEVVVGLGEIRLQADGFLELPDRLVNLAFPDEGDAEVAVGEGVIRFQADGFLVLADPLVDLAFLDDGDAEVVVGQGVIRFQADGFLELPNRLVNLAFLVEGAAEVEVREVIVLRDFERMPEQGFTVLPMPELLPRQRQAEDDRRCTRHRQGNHTVMPASGQFVHAPDGEDQHPKRWNISIPIRHRLFAHLHQPDHGHQRPAKPQPPHQQKGISPPLHKKQHRNDPLSTHPPAAPSPAANARGADRKRPDPLARTASPDSGSTKSARSRCAHRVAGPQPPTQSLPASAPRRSQRSPPPRGQRTGFSPSPIATRRLRLKRSKGQ